MSELHEKTQAPGAAKPAAKKKIAKELAWVEQDGCTGCGVCIDFCPVENCIVPVPGEHFHSVNPLVEVVADLCIGCKICVRECPWETIEMIPNPEFGKK